ncbi:putative ATP synthase, F0 complex, subunit A (mitochondrion) [Lupinus albus]|uniref:ATP synthase subunit a n=2 Tax=Lupinus albus TaxID=3870 RepID=A0A6A4MS20_LUPAL|nr:putative ATP synthase, F0 complex, subunit A [Lupinus albus]
MTFGTFLDLLLGILIFLLIALNISVLYSRGEVEDKNQKSTPGAVPQDKSNGTGESNGIKLEAGELTMCKCSRPKTTTLVRARRSPRLRRRGPLRQQKKENSGTINSPLDQFAIHPLIDMKIGDLYFSFTNPSLFMLLSLTLFLLLVHLVTKKGGGHLVPNAWQSLVELLYDFVLNLVNEQIGGLSGNVKQKFFPIILVTFLFLLFCNLQGMIPYSFTVTSHFLITLGLSFSLFIGITIVGFQRNGLHFLSFLLPAGVPLPLAPFLVLLELISYCFRALSLGIRLFANMMAGHSLVKILSGFAWTMLCMNDLLYFIGDLGPFFIVLALTGLELGVAILQAYVFTILICIYLNDAINLHQTVLSYVCFIF